eukprot:CAMPEP_0201550692 /NCGR_PEP_ID=MMETSP0173_2-20130828/7012_1 /ASSEMBLY_ACC=CAM_ASM_000268 /TAXON_ID=218659 /ORGANISM="Vexillifera sp., Strain DIVA3 564/2" /LENGTH=192 /DNA_ID=CAMNT_0047960737 /DNA_START=241 /DNA_END=819 /DNA_ORIENTATION=+
MVGKQCVAIASDTRFGAQAQTIATDRPKVFQINNSTFVGLSGLGTDVETVYEKLKFQSKLYKLREGRDMKPSTVGNVISTLLYEKRFGPYFVEPVVCGLEGKDNKPFIVSTDLIGCLSSAKDFVLTGTSSEALYGLCETFYKPNMEPDELFEVISQAMIAGLNRDALSGWGCQVTIITPEKIITRSLKARQD